MHPAVRTFALAVGLLLGGVITAPANGQSFRYVDDDAPPGQDGQTWSSAYKYLQDALFEASVSPEITEIRLGGGEYKPDQDDGGNVTPGDRSATFQLLDGVAVKGGYAGWADLENPDTRDISLYETTLTGDLAGDDDPPEFPNGPSFSDNSYHVVTGSGCDETAVLDGVTVTAGNATGTAPENAGGGMYNSGGSPTLADCTFSLNFSNTSGGGIYNLDASPTLTNCTIHTNHTTMRGGGMYNSGSSPTLTNCTFSDNLAANEYAMGGGMYNVDSSSTLTNCPFSGNQAYYGGGMYNDRSNAALINCTMRDNSAVGDFAKGGGVFNVNSSPTLADCTFGRNTACYGGGVYNGYSDPILTNCTFSGNDAKGFG